MRELKRDNFGLLIAYLLPGAVALWGLSYHVEAVRPWLQSPPAEAPSIGGFLYATLASTALGLVVSAVRWATIDRILARAGVRQPDWDFGLFAERLAAYEWLVANHYRYYQFYANMLVALAGAYASRALAAPAPWTREAALAAVFVATELVLLAGARDTLWKYYNRTEALLDRRPGKRVVARRGRGRGRTIEHRTSETGPPGKGAESLPGTPIVGSSVLAPNKGQSTSSESERSDNCGVSPNHPDPAPPGEPSSRGPTPRKSGRRPVASSATSKYRGGRGCR